MYYNPQQVLTSLPSITLEFWRTGLFLTHSLCMLFSLQLYLQHMQKISFISDMNNHVKTLSVLQVSPWSFGGQDGSWDTHKVFCSFENFIYSNCWKFHSFLTWITLSRLYLSSKSNFGGLDDGSILKFGMACGVSFTNIPCNWHSLVVFPGHLEPPVMRYYIWTCQFWDFKKVAVTQ